ncbi:hypothetical protein KSP40_PGU012526 [Platanthera guangdongensis]|uniref:Uncharacterized protein n=1 Tax=Platanthera guangdongensis TaxID=2320717 RepID=A0ABR2LDM2_9ASPA
MGHMESRVNQQVPPCKAKYSWVTDSEVVPNLLSAQKIVTTPAHPVRFSYIDGEPLLEAPAATTPPSLHPLLSLLLRETLAPRTSALAPRPLLAPLLHLSTITRSLRRSKPSRCKASAAYLPLPAWSSDYLPSNAQTGCTSFITGPIQPFSQKPPFRSENFRNSCASRSLLLHRRRATTRSPGRFHSSFTAPAAFAPFTGNPSTPHLGPRPSPLARASLASVDHHSKPPSLEAQSITWSSGYLPCKAQTGCTSFTTGPIQPISQGTKCKIPGSESDVGRHRRLHSKSLTLIATDSYR